VVDDDGLFIPGPAILKVLYGKWLGCGHLPWEAKNPSAKSSRFKNRIATKLPSPKRFRRC